MKANQLTKKIGLGFILLMLFAPMIQEKFQLLKFKPLEGYFEQVNNPDFSLDSFIVGSYQSNKEKYIDQNYGLRNFLIRLNNQYDLCLFKKINANRIVLGKNGILYGENYITSYLGENYLGEKKVTELTDKLKKLQNYFDQKNKTLIILLAPGKATFFPDDFPEQYNRKKKRNNHEEFLKQLNEKGINTLDFNSWFMSLKKKQSFPLFTELGIHWSVYGASVAFDSLVKYVEWKRKVDLPDYEIDKYEFPDTLRPPDEDIYRAANLLFEMKHVKAVYPILKIKTTDGKNMPTLLTVGDSFWWNIYNNGVTPSVFKDCKFWYYFNEAFPENYDKKTTVADLDFEAYVDKADVILLCYTESTLVTIGNGFIEMAHDKFCRETLSDEEKMNRIKNMMNYIKTDKKWMEAIKNKSLKEKIPVDSLIFYDARWQVEHN